MASTISKKVILGIDGRLAAWQYWDMTKDKPVKIMGENLDRVAKIKAHMLRKDSLKISTQALVNMGVADHTKRLMKMHGLK